MYTFLLVHFLGAFSKDFARDLKKMTWRAMELPNINAEGKSDVGAHAYRKLDVTGLALDQIKVVPRDDGCQGTN